jgi:hypothetical protein
MINCNCCLALKRLPCVQFLRCLGEVFETNHNGRTVYASLAIGMFRSVGYWTDFWSEVSLISVPWAQFWLEEVNLIQLYLNIEANVMNFAKTVPSYKQFAQRIWHDYDSVTTTPISKACSQHAVRRCCMRQPLYLCVFPFRIWTSSPALRFLVWMLRSRMQFQPHNCRFCRVGNENVMDAVACEMGATLNVGPWTDLW